ncbi:class I SAM-dependent methyltransferase [Hydrogenophaga pseudoflava]|uniref:class I SAM-dependent methyltransferase n=1 Tax=Hydrogenophaga pseudoflava TaxID=47421 RepID=UPI0027E53880|nr:class I SAM-dependent methyltransferase [Hydrogenophaga pseudoflava]MDQ7747346.1 class I SAM-dependent methyltransferase [Hydrogenophaga pseudoflava]
MTLPEARKGALKDDPRLRPYFSSEGERRQLTQTMFNEAAGGYDSAESLTALGSGAWYRRDVLRRNGLSAGMTLVDVAAGTGLVTVAGVELVGPSGRVIAVDPSPGMLAELRKKVSVETLEAFGEAIPLPDAQADFVSMGYALRHVDDLNKVLSEYLRVLKPGGKVCIMEISRPRGRLLRGLLRFHISVMVPLMARLTGRHADVQKLWAYYGDTIEAALDPATIMDALRRAGFADVDCSVSLGIFREYTGVRPA